VLVHLDDVAVLPEPRFVVFGCRRDEPVPEVNAERVEHTGDRGRTRTMHAEHDQSGPVPGWLCGTTALVGGHGAARWCGLLAFHP
jgi:hypothetical protein